MNVFCYILLFLETNLSDYKNVIISKFYYFRPEKPRFKSPFETSSGGFVPYTSMTRRSRSLGATTLVQSPSISHVSETSHWLTRNQVRNSEL